MTALLASVTDPQEAELALAGGADLIDLKDPTSGALGALPLALIRRCRQQVAGRVPVSATVGDLAPPALADGRAIEAVAGTGVALVKVGLDPRQARGPWLSRLCAHGKGIGLVAVLFADRPGVLDPAPLARAGFVGAMLDTAAKQAGGLRDCRPLGELAEFVGSARALGLLSGLAGSLSLDDIAPLLALAPDYLGFRGALCEAGQRGNGLDPARLRAVRAALRQRPLDLGPPAAALRCHS